MSRMDVSINKAEIELELSKIMHELAELETIVVDFETSSKEVQDGIGKSLQGTFECLTQVKKLVEQYKADAEKAKVIFTNYIAKLDSNANEFNVRM